MISRRIAKYTLNVYMHVSEDLRISYKFMYALSRVSFKIIQQQTTMEMVAFELW